MATIASLRLGHTSHVYVCVMRTGVLEGTSEYLYKCGFIESISDKVCSSRRVKRRGIGRGYIIRYSRYMS